MSINFRLLIPHKCVYIWAINFSNNFFSAINFNKTIFLKYTFNSWLLIFSHTKVTWNLFCMWSISKQFFFYSIKFTFDFLKKYRIRSHRLGDNVFVSMDKSHYKTKIFLCIRPNEAHVWRQTIVERMKMQLSHTNARTALLSLDCRCFVFAFRSYAFLFLRSVCLCCARTSHTAVHVCCSASIFDLLKA